MRRSSLALVMIGLLIGSTATLALTRQSSSQREILACTNKASGKVRLTVTGTCDPVRESESPVSDLWSLQPASPANPTTAESTTTVSLQLTKHVVDSNGKDLGELISNDGLILFWVKTASGVFQLTSGGSVNGQLGSTDPPTFADRRCSSAYLWYNAEQRLDLNLARAVFNPKDRNSSRNLVGFKVLGKPIATPKSMWIYNSPRDAKRYRQQQAASSTTIPNQNWLKSGCIQVSLDEIKDWPEGGFPKKVYRTTQVRIPTWSGALSIVEK